MKITNQFLSAVLALSLIANVVSANGLDPVKSTTEKPVYPKRHWSSTYLTKSHVSTYVSNIVTLGAYQPNTLIAVSNSGQYTLVFQNDKNLVLYKNGTTGLWSSGTQNQGISTCTFHTDGQIYLTAPGTPVGYTMWQSMAGTSTSFYWILQDDGNFVRVDLGYNPPYADTATYGGKKSRHDHEIKY